MEADLEDLEESVKYVWNQNLVLSDSDRDGVDTFFWKTERVVESTGPRLFNLDDVEVAERRRYVGRVKREITVRRGYVGWFPLWQC